MKTTAIIAYVLLAIDCILMARGDQKQFLFSDSFVWVWCIPAIGWLSAALKLAISYKIIPK